MPRLPVPQYSPTSGLQKDRQILVTFQDCTLDRIAPASPVDTYHAQLSYVADDWRTRTAEALALRHQLQLVTLWPIAALGVTCGVYWIPPDRPMHEVLEALGRDPSVDEVQSMHRFRPL